MNYKLAQIYKQVPLSTCPPGCGQCCGMLSPSLAEIRNIKEWVLKHGIGYKEFHMTSGRVCPYLGEQGDCRIYPVRPFLCRILGVWHDLPCPIQKITTRKTLNHAQGSALYRAIYFHGKEKARTERVRKALRTIFTKQGE